MSRLTVDGQALIAEFIRGMGSIESRDLVERLTAVTMDAINEFNADLLESFDIAALNMAEEVITRGFEVGVAVTLEPRP